MRTVLQCALGKPESHWGSLRLCSADISIVIMHQINRTMNWLLSVQQIFGCLAGRWLLLGKYHPFYLDIFCFRYPKKTFLFLYCLIGGFALLEYAISFILRYFKGNISGQFNILGPHSFLARNFYLIFSQHFLYLNRLLS